MYKIPNTVQRCTLGKLADSLESGWQNTVEGDRATSRAFACSEYHKSAITDHVCQNNLIMDWKANKIAEQESDKFKRWIKKSIHIRANTPNRNGDERAYHLSPIWSQVMSTSIQGGGGGGGGGSTE